MSELTTVFWTGALIFFIITETLWIKWENKRQNNLSFGEFIGLNIPLIMLSAVLSFINLMIYTGGELHMIIVGAQPDITKYSFLRPFMVYGGISLIFMFKYIIYHTFVNRGEQK